MRRGTCGFEQGRRALVASGVLMASTSAWALPDVFGLQPIDRGVSIDATERSVLELRYGSGAGATHLCTATVVTCTSALVARHCLHDGPSVVAPMNAFNRIAPENLSLWLPATLGAPSLPAGGLPVIATYDQPGGGDVALVQFAPVPGLVGPSASVAGIPVQCGWPDGPLSVMSTGPSVYNPFDGGVRHLWAGSLLDPGVPYAVPPGQHFAIEASAIGLPPDADMVSWGLSGAYTRLNWLTVHGDSGAPLLSGDGGISAVLSTTVVATGPQGNVSPSASYTYFGHVSASWIRDMLVPLSAYTLEDDFDALPGVDGNFASCAFGSAPTGPFEVRRALVLDIEQVKELMLADCRLDYDLVVHIKEAEREAVIPNAPNPPLVANAVVVQHHQLDVIVNGESLGPLTPESDDTVEDVSVNGITTYTTERLTTYRIPLEDIRAHFELDEEATIELNLTGQVALVSCVPNGPEAYAQIGFRALDAADPAVTFGPEFVYDDTIPMIEHGPGCPLTYP